MWEISLSQQALTVLLSIFMGLIFCLLYDIFKAARLFLGLKTVGVFVTDIIFFALSALIEFCFLLSRTAGEIRGFVLAGEAIGFFLCRFTASKIYLKLLLWIFSILKKAVAIINHTCCKFLDYICVFVKKKFKK